MTLDIRKIVEGWPYEPGELSVRKVVGDDGREKVQMRLDLGLLQMEMTGRPDGQRPHGAESLVHYHRKRLDAYRKRNGTDLGFELTAEQCQAMRAEAVMYYHRYLSLFVLEEFEQVERDTARNLQALDLLAKYAAKREDRVNFQQYRPYLIMMNTRAKAHTALKAKAYRSALAHVDAGLSAIAEFWQALDEEEDGADATEVMILQALRQEIVEQLPTDPIAKLERALEAAIDEERYEDAARLRDQIHQQRRQAREPK